jgi:signal peptidase
VAVLFLGGFLSGFGKTPYAATLTGILINIIFFGTLIVSKEMIRSFVVNSVSKKYKIYSMVAITVFMSLSEIKIRLIMEIKDKMSFLEFMGGDVLVVFSINILMTYLVYIGGSRFSITYLLVLQGVNILSPVLPDLMWIMKTFITVACVTITFVSIQFINSKVNRRVIIRTEKNTNPYSMVISGIIGIVIIWFTIGVFPIYPSIIVTGSMEPLIHAGDAVIVRKLTSDNLKVGDIVKYKSEDIYIFHRIVKIIEKDNQIYYEMKGDNNTKSDNELVVITDIKGEVIKVIPKIGWISLALRDNDIDKGRVEY